MKKTLRLWQLVVAAACLFSAAGSWALETSSAIRGVVTDQGGNAIANATVTVRNSKTSLERSVQAGADGGFIIRNLQVAGDYTVSASSSGLEDGQVEGVVLSLGRTSFVNLVLVNSAMEEVVVTAQRMTSQVAVGPSASFGQRELETYPAINRNVTDVLRIDPRIYVDESRGDINAIQCGGKNPRFNSWTIDGVSINDQFGLNANGFPTERIPFPYDSLSQVSVEMAPFDPIYGGFTACNINAVTKSGGNEFFGSVFFDYTDDSMRADSLEGDDLDNGNFDETRWGVTFGGPIIQDKLFFFGAYEKWEGVNQFNRGPIGSGAINEVQVTQAELDEITQIARDIYQYDPGSIPGNFGNEDEKILVKFDWYINEAHRLAFTYNYNDGFNIVESDGDIDEFEFSNHLYERGTELDSLQLTLFSDWTDRFSTQIRISQQEVDNRQVTIGGNDFGEIRIELEEDLDIGVDRGGLDDVDVYIGGDDSRQSNKLSYEVDNIFISGTYDFDNHSLKFGFERASLEVFNLFVQHTETEIRFRNDDDTLTSSIDNFRNGFAGAIYYNNAPSNNPQDAAAEWGYDVNTVFIQDDWAVNDRLDLLFGLRYDWYTSDDKPLENPDFVADYGFSNSTNLDGEALLQPRIGFTYQASDRLSFSGGVGIYSGGNPNVWLSNNFSANNVLQFGQRGRSFGYTDGSRSLFDPDVVYAAVESGAPSGPGYGIPQELFDAVATGVGDNFEINYLDPSFEIPSDWKYALGMAYEFDNNLTFTADVLITRGEDSAIILRGDLEQVGTNPDGYPEYDSVREASFVLTNSRKGNQSEVVSLAVSQFLDNGIEWRLGYAWANAEDISPMTSSVAFSNYQNRAFFDPQEQVLSTSNYEVEQRFTAILTYERAFFGDNLTRFTLFGQAATGPSYSYAFNGTIDPYGFTPFLDFRDNVLAPGDDRNDQSGSWWVKADVMIEQELEVGGGEASAFIVIDNFTNLLNDEWGIQREVNFPNTVRRGQAIEEPRVGESSQYEIRVGVRYRFN